MNSKGGRSAPDLSHVGSIRDVAWIAAKIYNPRLGNPGSVMPTAADLGLKEREVADVAAYLGGLK